MQPEQRSAALRQVQTIAHRVEEVVVLISPQADHHHYSVVGALLFAARRVDENIFMHLLGVALVRVEVPQPIVMKCLVPIGSRVEQKLRGEGVWPHTLTGLCQTLAAKQDRLTASRAVEGR